MARKKKIKQEEIKKELPAVSEKQSLQYQGKVCVKTLHGDKVISTKYFKNNGLPNLFKFISHALAGSFYPDMRPCKIKLYYADEGGDDNSPQNFKWAKTATAEATPKREVSPYVIYDATPIVNAYVDKETGETSYSTTFRFRIPYHWIFGDKYNVVGLFTNNNVDCAYYLFTTKENQAGGTTTTQTVWNTQELGNLTGNYSLLIEWTMEISNK